MLTMGVDLKEEDQGRVGAVKNSEEALVWSGSPVIF